MAVRAEIAHIASTRLSENGTDSKQHDDRDKEKLIAGRTAWPGR